MITSAISACADGADWRAALELLRELEMAHSEPSAAAYTEAIRACRACGQWTRSISLLERARSRGRSSCHTGAYAHVIGACDAAGEIQKAMEIYALGVQDKVFTHWVRVL